MFKPDDLEELERTVQVLAHAKTDNFLELMKLGGLDPAEDLCGADLSSTVLVGLNLSGFNFSESDLSRANLERAILDGANLQGARLDGAVLRFASLKGTDLRNARGTNVDLHGADLSQALTDGAVIQPLQPAQEQHDRSDRKKPGGDNAIPAVRQTLATGMKDYREILIGWLNDAYAMEKGIIPVLENHMKDAEKFPEVQTRLRAHLEQTRRQADQVQMLVERLGGSTSAAKTTMGAIGDFFSGLSTGAAPDELVKNALADYSTEHFEIASYRALIAGAQALGETEVVRVCEQILREEEEMARWLESNLPMLVNMYLVTEATVSAGTGGRGFGTSGTPSSGGTPRF